MLPLSRLGSYQRPNTSSSVSLSTMLQSTCIDEIPRKKSRPNSPESSSYQPMFNMTSPSSTPLTTPLQSPNLRPVNSFNKIVLPPLRHVFDIDEVSRPSQISSSAIATSRNRNDEEVKSILTRSMSHDKLSLRRWKGGRLKRCGHGGFSDNAFLIFPILLFIAPTSLQHHSPLFFFSHFSIFFGIQRLNRIVYRISTIL